MRTATSGFDLVFGVRVFGMNKLIRYAESVPGADRGPRAGSPRGVVDATGSPPIARIELARIVTRSLPLSVLML